MGEYLGFWSLRNASKTVAMLAIIFLSILIFTTREIPDQFDDEHKEWTMWRNLDFSFNIVSLMFASFLFYGSIVEFRLFVFAWIPWNAVLIVFWSVFLIWKHNEMVISERAFRIISIILMAYAEIPVYSYCREIRERDKDPESFATWIPSTSDDVFKTLCDRPSLSSVNSVFSSTSKSTENLARYQQATDSLKENASASSVTSEATEAFEEVNKEAKQTEKTPANSVVSVTVHASKSENATAEGDKNSTEVAVHSTGKTKNFTTIEIGEEGVFETIDESQEAAGLSKAVESNEQVGDLNSREDLLTASTGVTEAQQTDAEINIDVASDVKERREDSNIASQNETSSTDERPGSMLSNNEVVDTALHKIETNNEENEKNKE